MTKFSYICMDHPKGWWDCRPTALSYSVVRINSLWNSVCHYPSKLKEHFLMKNQICCFVSWYLKVHSLRCDHSHTTIGASSRLDLSWGCLLKDLCVASPGGLASPYGSCLPRMSNLQRDRHVYMYWFSCCTLELKQRRLCSTLIIKSVTTTLWKGEQIGLN